MQNTNYTSPNIVQIVAQSAEPSLTIQIDLFTSAAPGSHSRNLASAQLPCYSCWWRC